MKAISPQSKRSYRRFQRNWYMKTDGSLQKYKYAYPQWPLIVNQPQPLDSIILGKKNLKVEYIDDKILIIKNQDTWWSYCIEIILGLMALSFVALMAYLLLWLNTTNDPAYVVIFTQIITWPALAAIVGGIVYCVVVRVKNRYPYYCELNRLNGTVKFASMNIKGDVKEVPFFDCDAILHVVNEARSTRGSMRDTVKHIDFTYKINKKTYHIISLYSAVKSKDNLEILSSIFQIYSFFIWYMDKNRPLPPGALLDPYRQQDYQRRRAERFRAPLVESNVMMIDFDGVARFGSGNDFPEYDKFVQSLATFRYY
ncbi:hypothetical protein C9426_24795 [Serratia sp. S1B]|nr:hypothetical protein C9426_24795 [Serratia sp. S1B]